ncbi:MAG TPA: hypothetical protein VF768_05370 [Holophagaceae bacterium]
MDGWIKLPSGHFFNLNQICAVVKAGLDGSAGMLTQTGASIQVQPQDAKALRAFLDEVATPVAAPAGLDLAGGGH